MSGGVASARRERLDQIVREFGAVLKQSWFLSVRPRSRYYTFTMDYVSMGLNCDQLYRELVVRLGTSYQDHRLAVSEVLDGRIPRELHTLVWRHIGPDYVDGGVWYRLDNVETASKQPSTKKRDVGSVAPASTPATCDYCKTHFDSMWHYWGHKHGCNKKRYGRNSAQLPSTSKERHARHAAFLVMPERTSDGNVRVRLPRFPDVRKVPEVAQKIMKLESGIVRPPAWPVPSATDTLVIAVDRSPAFVGKGSYSGIVYAPADAPVSWLACTVARKWLLTRQDYSNGAVPSLHYSLLALAARPPPTAIVTDGVARGPDPGECRQINPGLLIIHQHRHVVQECFVNEVDRAWNRQQVKDAWSDRPTASERAPTIEECESSGKAWVDVIWPWPNCRQPSAELLAELQEYVAENDLIPEDNSDCVPMGYGQSGLHVVSPLTDDGVGVLCPRLRQDCPSQVGRGGVKALWQHVVASADGHDVATNTLHTKLDAAISDVLYPLAETMQPCATSMQSRIQGAASKYGDQYFLGPRKDRHTNTLTFHAGVGVTFSLTLLARKKPQLDRNFYRTAGTVLDASQMPLAAGMPLY